MSLLDISQKLSLLLNREVKVEQLTESKILSDFMNIHVKDAAWVNVLENMIDALAIKNFNHYLSIRPGYRNTFLHYLVSLNNTEMVWKFLRSLKSLDTIDYFICNNHGKNLLMIALEKGNVLLAKYFYEQMKNNGWHDDRMWIGELIERLAKTGPSQHPEYSILNNIPLTLNQADIPLILQDQYVCHLDCEYIWLDYLILSKEFNIQLGRLDNDDLTKNKVARQLFVEGVHEAISKKYSLVIWVIHGDQVFFENLPYNFRVIQTNSQRMDDQDNGLEPEQACLIYEATIPNLKWFKWAIKHEDRLTLDQLNKISDLCAYILGDYTKAMTCAHTTSFKDATCFNQFKLLYWQLKIAEMHHIPPLAPPLNLTIVLSDKKLGFLYSNVKACYFKQIGKYEEAIQSLKQALKYSTCLQQICAVYHDMYMILGDYLSKWRDALKIMQKTFDICKEHGSRIDQGHCLVFIGLAYSRLRNNQALDYYERALDLLPISRFTARIFELIGIHWCYESRLERATEYFLKSATIFEDAYKMDNPELARLYYEIAVCNPEKMQISIDYCSRAVEMYSRLNDGQDKIVVLRAILDKWIKYLQNLSSLSL